MKEFTFPAPLETDSDDVVSAVRTARSHWDSTDYSQAVIWLHKAAAAAESAGDTQRALELSQFASDAGNAGAKAGADSRYLQAIRVAVKRSVRDGELFVARLLEAQPVPPGSHEAFLVLTNPNVDLFDPTAS